MPHTFIYTDMFTLRRITGNGVEMNRILGDDYTFVHREFNPKEFRETFYNFFERHHVSDTDPSADENTRNCYAFVSNGCFTQPLYKAQKAFIMVSDGNTFANVSFK